MKTSIAIKLSIGKKRIAKKIVEVLIGNNFDPISIPKYLVNAGPTIVIDPYQRIPKIINHIANPA